MKYGYIIGVLLILVFAAVLAQTGIFWFEFLLWDDERIVYELYNRVTSPAGLILWTTNTNVTQLFTPVSLLFYGALADVWGIAATPFHTANVLLHLLNISLLYRIILRLFERQSESNHIPISHTFTAMAAAGFWGTHALRAEVFAWVAAVPYTLSTAFALLAVLRFIGTNPQAPRRNPVFPSTILFGLSVLSHPQTAPLCLAFPALDIYLGNRPPPDRYRLLTGMAGVKRYSGFLIIGFLALLFAALVRSSVESMPIHLNSDIVYSLPEEIKKLTGFTIHFSLVHAWFPRTISNVYNGYDMNNVLTVEIMGSLILCMLIFMVGLRQWRNGKKGLMIALFLHVAFCAPAAGLLMPNYSPADRYTYGITIVAAITLAFALRSIIGNTSTQLSPATSRPLIRAGLAGVVIMLCISFSRLLQTLPRWENTHTLMLQLQHTAPSQEWIFFAKVRTADYWTVCGNTEERDKVFAGFLDAPPGREEPSLVSAVQYLMMRNLYKEACNLIEKSTKPRSDDDVRQLNALLEECKKRI